jgi:hypothetical protein
MTKAEFEQFNLLEQAKLIYKKGTELMEYEQVFLTKYKKIFTLYALGNLYIESESLIFFYMQSVYMTYSLTGIC